MRTMREKRKNFYYLYTRFTEKTGPFVQWNRWNVANTPDTEKQVVEWLLFDTDTMDGIVPSISYFTTKSYPDIHIVFEKDDDAQTAYAVSMDKRDYTVYPQQVIEEVVEKLFNKLLTEEGWRDADA